jgi:sulfatase maturation enzyme AslB (radical SAM superfamily)
MLTQTGENSSSIRSKTGQEIDAQKTPTHERETEGIESMKVVPIERKSAVLTPSSLACLSNIATINLTAGCAHGCIYCYTQGYSNSPRDGTIHLYANTADKLAQELRRKRKLPRAVYFSPSSDLLCWTWLSECSPSSSSGTSGCRF